MQSVDSALSDADLILYVTDVVETFDKNQDYLDKIISTSIPKIIIINKIDLTDEDKLNRLYERWSELVPGADIIPLSALRNFNTGNLLKLILSKIPE